MDDEVQRHSKAPGAKCWECPFQSAPFVPTQNPHPRAKLVVIGEAPGAYEAVRGIPFTGPSGRLLDQVLHHHGYKRENTMITNICLCRPENNDDPPKAAIAACKPRLDRELAESGVEKILAVGGTAASNLIDQKKKISTLRIGAPKPYIEDPQVSVVATWHPAYCLRSPDAFPSFVSDTAKLRGKTYASWREPNIRTFNDASAIGLAIERLADMSGPIVIDIECGIEKDNTYVHPDQYGLLCVGIAYAPGQTVVFGGSGLTSSEIRPRFREYLRSRDIIAHNAKFDLAGLYPFFGELEAYADTMLMSYCLDERPGQHGLKKLGIELLGTPDWEAEIHKYIPRGGNYANIPRPVLYKYNAYDVAVTYDLWRLFSERFTDRERQQHEFLVKASNALMFLERAGIRFDSEYSVGLQTILEKELYEFELEIANTTGRALNPRSPMQITRWFAEQGISLPSTNKDLLERLLQRSNIPPVVRTFIGQLLLHRRRTKLNGTYVKGFQKRIYHGKVYTTYTLHGTTSGRLASKNPNMQNIVRDKRIKHQFTVESPENVLIQLDYKQAEGRVITTLAQDDYLASIFNDPDRDIFNELCNDIYGEGKWVKENRVSMKSIFYGNAYGRGVEAIYQELAQQGSSITLAETRKLMHDFNGVISKVITWQESVKRTILNGDDLTTPFGRKRSFWLITDQNRHDVLNEGLSFLPQSIASDICLTALIALQPKLRGLATTRLTIHDAMIFECKETDADQVIDIASTEMVASGKAFTDYVPFVVDVSKGKRWSDL
jgi:uracil-DNA glycosylase family 4